MTDPTISGRTRRRSSDAAPIDRLSPRERQVLDAVVDGLTNRAIGARLGISHRTVEIHRARVMRKLNATSLAGLISIALAYRFGGRQHSPERNERC